MNEPELVLQRPTVEQLVTLLARARTILNNMAWEREYGWERMVKGRWPIHHEPLRNDAQNLLPLIDEAIRGYD